MMDRRLCLLLSVVLLTPTGRVGAQQADLVAQLGHTAVINASAFSPDGQRVLTGSHDGTARLWDVRTGRELRRFAHGSPLHLVAFSPDGRVGLTVRAPDDRVPGPRVRLVDLATGKLAGSVEIDEKIDVASAVFSPDGHRLLLAGSLPDRQGIALLWDVRTGRELLRFQGHADDVTQAVFSADGRLVLTASMDHTARLWDAATGHELRRFGEAQQPARDLAFAFNPKHGLKSADLSPDARLVVTGDVTGAVRLWDATTGEPVRELRGHRDIVYSVSFSPDGTRAMAVSRDSTARLWSIPDGEPIRVLAGSTGALTSGRFSPSGYEVLTTSGGRGGGAALLWSVATGERVRMLQGQVYGIETVALSQDGRIIVTAGLDGTARLWSLEKGQARTLAHDDPEVGILAAAFADGGSRVLTRSTDGTVRLWDVASGQELARMEHGDTVYLQDMAVSADGRRVLTRAPGAAWLWDAVTGKRLAGTATKDALNDPEFAFSPDGRRAVVTEGRNNTVLLWDTETGRTLHRLTGHRGPVDAAVFSPDGTLLLTTSEDSTARLWEVETGRELRVLAGHRGAVTSAAFSADGERVATAAFDNTVRVWSASNGRALQVIATGAWPATMAISPDGERIVTGTLDAGVQLWNATTGERLARRPGGRSASFSPDGEQVLVGGAVSGDLFLWNAASGAELASLQGHSYTVESAAFGRREDLLATGSGDGSVRLWRAKDGREIAQLLAFQNSDWVVVSPDGRFDTSNLEEMRGLHWILAESPYEALPLEIFMRDYYEPRLLPRLVAGEKLPPIRDLRELNLVQPQVSLAARPEPGDSTVAITVVVRDGRAAARGGGAGTQQRSGAHDLHLFREGQIVGRVEGDLLQGRDSVVHTFAGVRLPLGEGADTVSFAAYAFNSDRVKSATARDTLRVPASLPRRKGRAYVVSLGVNAYSDPAWNLQFAANDARLFQRVLGERLDATGRYAEVVRVPLISDHQAVASTDASKAALRAVLDVLAGREASPGALARVPNADRLRRATPEDLVLISISTHGYTDQQGVFYLLPQDVGAPAAERSISPELLRHAVSSEELSDWLLDVDAGEMAMVVDACHSAAAVEGAGFKPGPMGSRGLGQLAYNKGMRILTASQADDVALESDKLRQGLLTYALVRDGLEARAADHQPEDAVIWLGEWLEYGVQRVPTLYEEMLRGEITDPGTGRAARAEMVGDGLQDRSSIARRRQQRQRPVQQPSLFDFRRRGGTVVLDAARD